jgi:hypothetical protein
VLLYNCKIPAAPKCIVGEPELTLNGLLGREGSEIYEKVDVSGSWGMSGTGCPFTGSKAISGSTGAYVESTGFANVEYFESFAEGLVKATGLRINGETWRVSGEIETAPSGSNYGKAFGVQ